MNYSVLRILDTLVNFYSTLIIVYVVLSWFPASGFVGDLRRVLSQVCEPWIGLFRRIVPVMAVGGAGLDLSPLVAYFVLRYGWAYLWVRFSLAHCDSAVFGLYSWNAGIANVLGGKRSS